MKKIILILSVLFFFTGCNEEETKQVDNRIYGTWQLVETYISDGGSFNEWVSVSNGFVFTINKDNTFSSNRSKRCTIGTYSINANNNQINFKYECANYFPPCESNSPNCLENFQFEDGGLVLWPTYRNCAEGCGEFFKRIASK